MEKAKERRWGGGRAKKVSHSYIYIFSLVHRGVGWFVGSESGRLREVSDFVERKENRRNALERVRCIGHAPREACPSSLARVSVYSARFFSIPRGN